MDVIDKMFCYFFVMFTLAVISNRVGEIRDLLKGKK